MPEDVSAEATIRHEIERRKEAFTHLAVGMCIMVVGLVFLAIFGFSGYFPGLGGAFVVIILGLYLYNRGHQGRVQVRALEYQLASLGKGSGQEQAAAKPSTKFCKHCGKVVTKDSAFCEHCGRAL